MNLPSFARRLWSLGPSPTKHRTVGSVAPARIRHGSVHGPGSGSDVVLRTPDACFAELHDYPFEPHYWEYEGMRLHYIDEGAGEGDEIVLMLHGEPTWSFLYRKIVPQLVAKGS